MRSKNALCAAILPANTYKKPPLRIIKHLTPWSKVQDIYNARQGQAACTHTHALISRQRNRFLTADPRQSCPSTKHAYLLCDALIATFWHLQHQSWLSSTEGKSKRRRRNVSRSACTTSPCGLCSVVPNFYRELRAQQQLRTCPQCLVVHSTSIHPAVHSRMWYKCMSTEIMIKNATHSGARTVKTKAKNQPPAPR